ncbi:hypothetical protein [Halocatena salina]|uniref:Uncharacterized protein n=1 Tax=Halocatena salina TaxID=2934340 RepID=A0A8U0A7U5_9EURY|nr:hypothetical protein [Halocatena salina]UPM45271.1 hypothetical protein MW046_19180 [Halocatena salina]
MGPLGVYAPRPAEGATFHALVRVLADNYEADRSVLGTETSPVTDISGWHTAIRVPPDSSLVLRVAAEWTSLVAPVAPELPVPAAPSTS